MPPDSSPAARFGRLLNLKTFPGFSGLSNENVASIVGSAVERQFPAGAELYGEAEGGQYIHYIIEGRVAVERGGRVEAEIGGRGIVGGLAALAGGIPQRAFAVEDSTTYQVHISKFFDMFEDNFHMMLGALKGIAGAFVEARKLAGPRAGFAEDFERVPTPPPMSLVDRLFYLHESLAFTGSRISSLTELATWARELREPAGTVLWREGDSSDSFLLVLSGVIRCDTGEQTFRIGPRGAAGTLNSLGGSPRWFTATVEEDLVALRLEAEQLLDIFEDHVDMAMDLLRVMAKGLLALRDKLAAEPTAAADAP